jgi:murein DD-endopeptidase MepM/ murein hydrolase activator NlpD
VAIHIWGLHEWIGVSIIYESMNKLSLGALCILFIALLFIQPKTPVQETLLVQDLVDGITTEQETLEILEVSAIIPLSTAIIDRKESVYTIKDGETFIGIMQREGGLGHQEVLEILEETERVFDVRKMRSGDLVRFLFVQEALAAVEYDINADSKLTITTDADIVVVEEVPIEYEIVPANTSGVIDTSLYESGVAAGMTDKAIMETARIFSWDIDFATNIQPGDSFSVSYENRYRDGEFVGIGNIFAARFTNSGEDYYAFGVPSKEGVYAYYNEQGQSTQRMLLKSPLNYSRVSSQFTYRRKHPISGTTRKHEGIDLVAKTGTPVETVGNGTVTFAGTNGGYGKFIKISHGGGYETAYAHLSKINVKKGEKVKQGEVIGEVGSTGASTGPHLHYEMIVDGVAKDPFAVKTPAGENISESDRSQFEAIKEQYSIPLED